MIFNEAAICANLSGALAQKVEQITETAIARASTRTAGQYDGQTDAILAQISTAGAAVTVTLNYDPSRNPINTYFAGGTGGSAYWVAEYGKGGRVAAPVIRVAAEIIKNDLKGVS